MSVTTSAANVEPPPLLFGQLSPSSPGFSSPPQSPNHLHHQTQSPASSPLPPPPPPVSDDVDMSSSTTLPPPAAQNHDRQGDSLMQDSESLANGNNIPDTNTTTTTNTNTNTNTASNQDNLPSINNVAVEVAAVDEDAMDTTPDNSQNLVLPNGSTDSNNTPPVPSPTPADAPAPAPAPNGVGEEQTDSSVPPEIPLPDQPIQQEAVDPLEPPPPADPNAQPPPPPPEPIRSDSDSSDDDDGTPPWHPIPEDTSSPDEAELKEIESGPEYSALDHDHWEKKAFTPIDAPEYKAGPSGRIHWAIDSYNGTKEKPNRELVMKSEPVTIGGHQWQIKFYPKGNDSDYLSVYVECLSVMEKDSAKSETSEESKDEFKEESKEESKQDSTDEAMEDSKDGSNEEAKTGEGDAPKVETESTDDATPPEAKEELKTEPKEESKAVESENDPEPEPVEYQHTPLALLDVDAIPKRKSVAAQVCVVLYNPDEPRVNYSRTCLHRFCTGSPDWGWTRFHGPCYEISHRLRLQRQALLRNDKLAFTGYIRIVEDETNCLWEHHSSDNPWDSFAMTGLQSISLGDATNSPGGNFISAIASWMLFKPFRQFLYNFKVPDPDTEPTTRPKPIIAALQKVLYMLRTQVKPKSGPVTLDDILGALDWYGFSEKVDKLDVIEVWEILRSKVEEELHGTPQANTFEDLFGPKKNYSLGTPSYRAPVLNVGTMQEAVNQAPELLHPSAPLPQLLSIELARQEFDIPTRSYVKLMNKVTLDEHITVKDTPYTLFGFVVHKQTLQSYIYHPVLRPEGPGTKWYHYTDGREENMVKCLTQSEAVGAHEGKAGSDKVIGNDPVAYIVMYVRDDITESTFKSDSATEDWQVAGWIREEIERDQSSRVPPPMPPPPMLEQTSDSTTDKDKEPEPEPLVEEDHQVFDSKLYLQHEGPGTFDLYDAKWQAGHSDLIYSVRLSDKDRLEDIREKLATVIKDIKNPRQIKYWFLDTQEGSFARPCLAGTRFVEYSSGSVDPYMDVSKKWRFGDTPYWKTNCPLWVHVIDEADVTPLPEEPQVPEPPPAPPAPSAEVPDPVPIVEGTTVEGDAVGESTGTVPIAEDSAVGESVVDGNSVEASAAPLDIPAPTVPPQSDPASEDTPMSEPEDPVQAVNPPQPVSETQPEIAQGNMVQAENPQTEIPQAEIAQIEIPQTEVDESQGVPTEGVPAPVPADNAVIGDTTMGEAEVEVDVELAIEPAQVVDPPPVDVVIPNPIVPESGDTEMGGTQEDLLPPPPPPPPPAEFLFDPGLPPPMPPQDFIPPPPPPPPPVVIPDEIYFFLKFFDPETQKLEPRGSYICPRSSRLDTTISSLLGLPSEKKIDVYEEDDLVTTRTLKGRHSFSRNDLSNASILIAMFPLSEEKCGSLADRAAFADPQAYLVYRAKARNFPTTLNGHFTFNYFSSQYYKGEFKNGHRHGHGSRIYHSGATYEGSFRLSQRHGHGLYTFQNGDTYDGDWIANQQHGTGTFVESATGNTYVGGWKHDKKFGEGVTHWKNAQEAERLCRICWEENADAAFYDCGHVVACLSCARRVENCPVCRKRVMSAMKLFYVS